MNFLIDFTNYKSNNKHYGGNAGLKKGIVYEGKNWLLKFPQETSSFDSVEISFTTSPLSEYIGSHIYQMLGYNAHNTKLGYFYNERFKRKQIVVACEDFTDDGRLELLDYESIKNNYSDSLQDGLIEVNESLSNSPSNSISQHNIRIEDVIAQFKNNDLIKSNLELQSLFWDMMVVDCVINNNDRNKNNWGMLFDPRKIVYTPAPIYDNGASFVSKHSEEKLKGIMSSMDKMRNSVLNGMCYYTIDNKLMNFKNFFNRLKLKELDGDLSKAILRVNEKFKAKWEAIKEFINNIPNEENGLTIITDTQKKFFIDSMYIRLKEIFNCNI